METVENKYITVAYKLYTVEDGEKELFEETNAEHPFQFISGLGTTLESFICRNGKIEFITLRKSCYLVLEAFERCA